jgi:hypothetical protein
MLSRRIATRGQRGMCTAEYAVGTVAACGLACILIQLLPDWRALLMAILTKALAVGVGWPFAGLDW